MCAIAGIIGLDCAPETLEKILTQALVPEQEEDGLSRTLEQLLKKLNSKEDGNHEA